MQKDVVRLIKLIAPVIEQIVQLEMAVLVQNILGIRHQPVLNVLKLALKLSLMLRTQRMQLQQILHLILLYGRHATLLI